MVEKDTILKEQVKFKGITSLKDAYNHAYRWLRDEDFDIVENKYTEKVDSSGEKELEILWTADKRVTDYFKFQLAIQWRIYNMTDVEVEVEGKKMKMNKFGELKMNIKGILIKDYENRWDKTRLFKFFSEAYHKYVIPRTTEDRRYDLIDFVQDFKDEMKAFLDLTSRREVLRIGFE